MGDLNTYYHQVTIGSIRQKLKFNTLPELATVTSGNKLAGSAIINRITIDFGTSYSLFGYKKNIKLYHVPSIMELIPKTQSDKNLTHFNQQSNARMVDVGNIEISKQVAIT